MAAERISGLHHVTAIASDAQANLDFYAGILGFRLVKRTVNFDDPGTYHFYFGDETGSPGTILTFFPWTGVPRGTTPAVRCGVIPKLAHRSLSCRRRHLHNAGAHQSRTMMRIFVGSVTPHAVMDVDGRHVVGERPECVP